MTTPISRREAVQRVIALMGGLALVIDEERLLAAAIDDAVLSRTLSQGVGTFTAADIALLDEIADTILPATSTPGAKAAKTGPFMALMVTDVYSDRDQQVFRDGMRALEDACRAMHGTGFMQATPAQRLSLLQVLDREQKTAMEERINPARTRYPAAHAGARRARALLPHDEGAGAARLFHLGDRLHAGDALSRDARALRPRCAARARRQVVGGPRLGQVGQVGRVGQVGQVGRSVQGG